MGLVLKHFDKTGGVQLTSKNWGNALAGATLTAEKFFVQNVGDRDSLALTLQLTQVGSNDGQSMVRIGLDTATVMPPYGLAAVLTSAGAGGLWGAVGTREYLLTAYNATGETVGCIPVTANVDVVTKKVVLTWSSVTGATGYKLYRTDTPGTYGASTLRATLVGQSQNTFTDDGSATSGGTPPSSNTTAGGSPNYGTPPALGLGPLSLGVLKVGQWASYWVNRVIPGGTLEAGNPRQSIREFIET
jgi:hypothetical protein